MAQIHPLENKTKLVSLLVSGGEVHVPRSIFLVKPGAGIRYKTSHQNPKKQAPGWPWQSRVSESPRKVTRVSGDRNRQERGSTASLVTSGGFSQHPTAKTPSSRKFGGKSMGSGNNGRGRRNWKKGERWKERGERRGKKGGGDGGVELKSQQSLKGRFHGAN